MWRAGGKENGLDVEADTTKYVALSQGHNAGRSSQVNIYNTSCGKGGTIQIFGNNNNGSQLYSTRN